MAALSVSEIVKISGCCETTIRLRIKKGLTGSKLTEKPNGRGGHFKITEQQARKCWDLILDGLTINQAAKESGISYSQAQNIKFGAAWNHITGLPKYERKDDW